MVHRLLMIDDDEEAIRQVGAFLDPDVYSIESATDPLEGIEFARNYKPELIILDLQMNPLDGFGVIRRLQQRHETKHIPIIIFSIVGDRDENILRGLGLGAEYIVFKGREKPLQILEMTIEKQLKNKRGPAASAFYAGEHELKVTENAGRVWRDDKEIPLTLCQRKILWCLIEADGNFISTDEILTLIGKECRDDEFIIATQGYAYKFIHDLRKSIEPDPGKPVFLTSQRDLGYRLSHNGL